jgi:type IV pilus assembly protein PilB
MKAEHETKHGIVANLLVRAGIVDATAIAGAVEIQAARGGTLPKILSALGLADEEAACTAIANGLRLEYVGPDAVSGLGDEVTALLPTDFSRERLVLSLGLDGASFRLAMANPLDYRTLQDVEFRTGKRVVAVVASETVVRSKLDRVGAGDRSDDTFDIFLKDVTPAGEVEWEAPSEVEMTRGGSLPPVIRVVNMILSDAARARASDVHVEPQEGHLLVRRRIDGLLEDVMRIRRDLQNAVISRLKIISGMDIAERRKPQDGRSTLRLGDRRVDLRLSSLPTQFGEKIVVRLLDSEQRQLDLAKLIGTGDCLQKLRELLSRPQGMLLVAAPTGSGKTTTLYAALSWLRSTTKNIITVEDPIEYQLPGVNQVQINPKAGVTFASGLRSILRQDPNIVLVGEIRDQETASIALEAAQTGHLLLSTVHANDTAGTITRLLDLGIEPFLIASSIVGVLAQRLVRRPCAACARPAAPGPEDVERVGGTTRLPAGAEWKAGAGCKECGESGYRGRLAVHELMYLNDELRELVSRRASEDELREAARRAGMRTLMEDGIAKAAQGLTTLQELARAVPPDSGRLAAATLPAAPGVAATTQRPAPAASTAPANGRVLVVEDSPTIVTVVQYYLELEGFTVTVAADGAQGLALARQERPDVVVTDLSMPGMDGIALVQALRADPNTTRTPILVLTADTNPEREEEGLAVGADDYMSKPVEPRRLAARVRALVKRAERRGPPGDDQGASR